MDVLVPFDARDPKTRLSPILDPSERRTFARAMLTDVLDVLRDAGHQPELLATAPISCPCPVSVDDRPLTTAVNAVLAERTEPLAIVMADLALLTTDAVERLCSPNADVVLAPGRGGGTNAMVVRHPDFRVDYHGVSFRDHCGQARACDATLSTVDSFRIAADIDEPADLVDLLVYGEGEAHEWLDEADFTVVERDGKPAARRHGENR
jgi:2-phospho-L-lactate guanylyltransferase